MDQSQLYGRTLKVSTSRVQTEGFSVHNSKLAGVYFYYFYKWTRSLIQANANSVWEQEGWLQKHEVDEKDRIAVESKTESSLETDPMASLDSSMAGPRPE